MGEDYWNSQRLGSAKRPRTGFDVIPSQRITTPETQHYLDKTDDWGGPRAIKDTPSIGSAYDNYLRKSQIPSEEGNQHDQVGVGRDFIGDLSSLPMRNPVAARRPETFVPEVSPNSRGLGFGGLLPVDRFIKPHEPLRLALPPDATSTLYIDGLPTDCTKRELAHIFRPFVGYKEVRLIKKEPKHVKGGDPLIMSFVDFADPACAATALSTLQGYTMDEHEPQSSRLRLQFSKFPGARSNAGPRGRR